MISIVYSYESKEPHWLGTASGTKSSLGADDGGFMQFSLRDVISDRWGPAHREPEPAPTFTGGLRAGTQF